MINRPYEQIIWIVSICCLFVGCNYHFNAFDPQLEPPAYKDNIVADTIAEDVPQADQIGAGADLHANPDEVDDADDGVSDDTNGLSNDQVINGCTDPEALNYDPAATADDGSCLSNVLITFKLDTSCAKNAPAPQVAGGDTFGMPGDNPMSDEDKDEIWTVTIELPPTLSTNYTYTGDVCDNWSCKENISGQDCAIEPYNDRNMNTGIEDQTILACFAHCGEGFCGQCPLFGPDSGSVESCATPQIKVGFSVDMSSAWAVAQDNTIALQGSFDDFYPGIVMERTPGEKIYSVSICLEQNTDYTFKFASYEFANNANEFPDGEYATDATPCPGETKTVDCDFGTCTERLLHTGEDDMVLEVLPWGGCL
jgi:hypothetical protein